jgi:hypothetical protein
MNIFRPQDYGARANGSNDDTTAVSTALSAAMGVDGCVEFPPGTYRITESMVRLVGNHSLSLRGYGPNVSRLLFENCDGFTFLMEQDGIHQPYGLDIQGVSFNAGAGQCGRGLKISMGQPTASNEHGGCPLRLRDVEVRSNAHSYWTEGIEIEGIWNPKLDDVFVSGGSYGGDWKQMTGAGVKLRGMCVNAHLSNVRTNFWATGLQVHAEKYNTEGLFCSNCSMVAVKRGVWLRGDPYVGAGRIHTLQWQGGMIENRFGGVTGGLAAFHLEHTHGVSIMGCQMIPETINCLEASYGVIAQNCRNVQIQGCEINAYSHGVLTTDVCSGFNIVGNNFPHTTNPVTFNTGTYSSQQRDNLHGEAGAIPGLSV